MGTAREQIIAFVQGYMETNMDLLKYDKTVFGKVISISGSSAIVELNGQQVSSRIKDGVSIAVGDVVIIKIPNNNKNMKYIDGKLKK